MMPPLVETFLPMGYYPLYDAPSGGNLLAYGVLSVEKNILNGDTASIAIGQLTVSMS